jgi:hypothetical protein
MSEAAVTEAVNEMKSPKTFDARAAARGATMAKGKVTVYTDAETAHELNELLDQIADLKLQAGTERAKGTHGIEGSPEAERLEEEARVLEAKAEELVEQVRQSALTFTVRGIAPVQWRLIDSSWRKKIKQPVRSNYPDTPEGTEAFETEALERQIARNNGINWEQVAKAIVSVENLAGEVDANAWTVDDVEQLHANLLEVEWFKLKGKVDDLTHAHTIFNEVIVKDADFLQKP